MNHYVVDSSSAIQHVPQNSEGIKPEEMQELQEKYEKQIDKLKMTITKLMDDVSKFDEEKELIKDKYSYDILKLKKANDQLSLRLKEEFEDSKKNINDECTLMITRDGEEISRHPIKLYSVSEPSIFDQMHKFSPFGHWNSLVLFDIQYGNKCIYNYDKMLKRRLIEKTNTIKEGLRKFVSNKTIIQVNIGTRYSST